MDISTPVLLTDEELALIGRALDLLCIARRGDQALPFAVAEELGQDADAADALASFADDAYGGRLAA